MNNPYPNNNAGGGGGGGLISTMNGSFDEYDSIDGGAFSIVAHKDVTNGDDDVSSIHMSVHSGQDNNGHHEQSHEHDHVGEVDATGGVADGWISTNNNSNNNNNVNVNVNYDMSDGDLGIDASDVSAILGTNIHDDNSDDHNHRITDNTNYYTAYDGEDTSVDDSQLMMTIRNNHFKNNNNNGSLSSSADENNGCDGTAMPLQYNPHHRQQQQEQQDEQQEQKIRIQQRNNIKLGPLGDELSYAGDSQNNNIDDDDDGDNNMEGAVSNAYDNRGYGHHDTAHDNNNYNNYNLDEDNEGIIPDWIYNTSKRMKCVLVVSVALIMGSMVLAGVAISMANTNTNNRNNNGVDGSYNYEGGSSSIERASDSGGLQEVDNNINNNNNNNMPMVVTTSFVPTISMVPTKAPISSTTGEAGGQELEATTTTTTATATSTTSTFATTTAAAAAAGNTDSLTKVPTTTSPSNSNTNTATTTPPSSSPTTKPTSSPTTDSPISTPPTTSHPSSVIPTVTPSTIPTMALTSAPPTAGPTNDFTASPSFMPSTSSTTIHPTTTTPSNTPSSSPTAYPTVGITTTTPSMIPTTKPSFIATPTYSPIIIDDIMGDQAAIPGQATFYLMSDGGNNVNFWKNKLNGLSGAEFMFHLGSAVRRVDDCAEDSYINTMTSLSAATVPVYSLPGNFDWPECTDSELGWEHYKTHMMNINTMYWNVTTDYIVNRQEKRVENYAFLYKRVLYIGLHMVTNSNEEETAQRLADNTQWVNENSNNYIGNMDAIFIMGNGRLLAPENIPFYKEMMTKKTNDWKDVLFVYARRSGVSGLTRDIGGLEGFHELRVGTEWPIMDVQLQTGGKDVKLQFREASVANARKVGGDDDDGLI